MCDAFTNPQPKKPPLSRRKPERGRRCQLSIEKHETDSKPEPETAAVLDAEASAVGVRGVPNVNDYLRGKICAALALGLSQREAARWFSVSRPHDQPATRARPRVRREGKRTGQTRAASAAFASAAGGRQVEAAGIEPASRDISMQASTRVVEYLIVVRAGPYRLGSARIIWELV